MSNYKCPECGEFIISCSMCENHYCNNCDYDKVTTALQKTKEVKDAR